MLTGSDAGEVCPSFGDSARSFPGFCEQLWPVHNTPSVPAWDNANDLSLDEDSGRSLVAG